MPPTRTLLRIANIVLVIGVIILSALPTQPPREGFTPAPPAPAPGPPPPWHTHIDIIYYINLDHREDRKNQFLQEMANAGVPPDKIVRISAVAKPGQGDWGCSLSHRNALTQFLQTEPTPTNPYRNCLIFEDDFMFTQPPEVLDPVFQELHTPTSSTPPYDVCMLSCNPGHTEPLPHHPHLRKVYEAQTASGYLVSRQFAPVLLQNYQEGSRLIEQSYQDQGKDPQAQHPYCIDQYWKRLQPLSQWLVLEPTVGKQRDSYSDIQGGFVRMTV